MTYYDPIVLHCYGTMHRENIGHCIAHCEKMTGIFLLVLYVGGACCNESRCIFAVCTA